MTKERFNVHVCATIAQIAHEAINARIPPFFVLQPVAAQIRDNGFLVVARDPLMKPLKVALGADHLSEVI
jgi:hypothetical protein